MTKQRTATSTGVKTRVEKFNGREHIVVPVVALVEGVIQAMNAGNPEFVAAEEFSKAPVGWNGRPVFVDHPTVGGVPVFGNQPSILENRQVGTIFNATASKGKLTMEAWIDVERAKVVDPALLERVQAGDPIEVSVGLLCNTADEQGVYNGKKYNGAWKELIPDHLALLSKGHIGACSREMGCGVRAASIKHEGEKWVLYSHDGKKKLGSYDSEEQAKRRERQVNYFKKDAMRIDKTFGAIFARMAEVFRGAQPSREMTGGDLLRKLSDAVRAVDPTLTYVETYLPVKNPNRVIYMCYHPDPQNASGEVVPAATRLYERSFSLGTDGAVTLGEDVTEVEPVMYYEPVVRAACGATCECGGTCGEKRDAVGNGCNQYGCPDGAGGGGKDDKGDGPEANLGDSDREDLSSLMQEQSELAEDAPEEFGDPELLKNISAKVKNGEKLTPDERKALVKSLEDWADNQHDDIREDEEENQEERYEYLDKIETLITKFKGAEGDVDLRKLLRRAAHRFVK